MQMVSEVMTRDVMFVAPQESLQRAAQMMDELNVGVLPVCDGQRLVGMVTDRDLTIRGIAAGKAPQDAHVDEVMSGEVRWCFEDQPLDEVMIQMADSQIRRVPVVSHDELHRLIGIVALGDLATRTTDNAEKQDLEQVVEMVSEPSEPQRSQQPEGARAAGGAAAGTGNAAGAGKRDFVGAPGTASAPGAAAGDKEIIGSGPAESTTGAGRKGRVGFAGDPGGLSPADSAEQQSAAPGTGANAAGNAPTEGTTGAAPSSAGSTGASTGGAAGETTGKGGGAAKP
jgi:CBS domain-containing protein